MRVLVEKVESYDGVKDLVCKAFQFFKPKLDKVFVKPNFLKFDSPENGCITHPAVVEAVIECVGECVIVEGGFWKNSADKCFDAFNLREKARCINLNRDEFVKLRVDGRSLRDVTVAKTSLLVREGTFISLPKMKVHHLTRVTLSIKNNMGFLKKPAIYMHVNIHTKLVDLLKIFYPDFVLIDGVIGGEGSESRTKPVKHGVMVASDNPVAADIVAAELMGFDWKEIEHLRLAALEFGVERDNIEITGADIDGLKKKYELSLFSRFLGGVGV